MFDNISEARRSKVAAFKKNYNETGSSKQSLRETNDIVNNLNLLCGRP